MMTILAFLYCLPLFWLLARTFALYRNYRAARNLGIPVILSPVSWQDGFWLPIQPLLAPLKHLPLPSALTDWLTFSTLGWALEHRFTPHLKYGPIFAIVSPRKTEFVVADPIAGEELLSQTKIWTKSPELYKIFEVFGQNVNSVPSEGGWARHRKIVSHGFKESNIKLVWDSSLRQAAYLGRSWETRTKTVGSVSCRELEADTGLFSLLVLAAALWGEEHEFGEDEGLGSRKPPMGHQMSYKDALKEIMDKILMVLLFDALVLPGWMMPSSLGKLKVATGEYRSYLQEKVESERAYLAEGGNERANLAAILVTANEKAKSDDRKIETGAKGYLTDDELFGNFFMLNLAGHETTATTLSFTMSLLGSHPNVQSWIREEIDEVFDPSKSYNELYPHLPRVTAAMYETLRIYGAVQNLLRYSRDGHVGQPLTIGNQTYVMPASSYVSVNFQALHTSPDLWGEDSLEWKPQRWISTTPSSNDSKAGNIFGEHLGGPPAGATFVAWALGPRDCPGRKFSKVEFVATIAYLLKHYEIKPATRAGETEIEATKRLYSVVHDCYQTLAPRFRRPDDAGIVLKAR